MKIPESERGKQKWHFSFQNSNSISHRDKWVDKFISFKMISSFRRALLKRFCEEKIERKTKISLSLGSDMWNRAAYLKMTHQNKNLQVQWRIKKQIVPWRCLSSLGFCLTLKWIVHRIDLFVSTHHRQHGISSSDVTKLFIEFWSQMTRISPWLC